MSPDFGRRARARHLAGVALAILCLAAAPSAAAQRTLTVAVTDADGETLPGATVVTPDLMQAAAPTQARGAASGVDGVAVLRDLPADTVRVVVSFVGTVPHRETVDLRAGDVRLGVALATDITFEEIRIESDNPLDRDTRSVSVVEGDELDARRGQTLAETLDGLPGVTTLSTGPTIGKPVVRGLHSDRVVILEDGVRQESQAWGGEHAPEIDPFAAGRIEVIRGAAGVEIGAGAIGGAVKLNARDLPTTPGVSGQLSMQAFSNSGQGAASLVVEDAPASWNGFAWRAQGSLRRAGDARTPDVVIANSAFAEASGHLTLGYTRGDTEIDAHVKRYAAELGIYRGSHFGTFTDLQAIIERGGPDPDWNYGFGYGIAAPKQVVTHDVASIHGHTTLWGGHLDAQVAAQRNRRREFDAHRRFGDGDPESAAFDLGLDTQSLDVAFTPAPGRRVVGKVGVQARTQLNKNAASGTLVPNYRAYDGGLFGHLTFAASDALTLEAGARLDGRIVNAFPYQRATRSYERDARSYGGGALAVGALQTLGRSWSLGVNAGSAWRPPNVAELYSDGVHHGTAMFEIGDAALDPEHSLDMSATVRHESRAASAEVSVYVNHIFDYVYALDRPEPTVTIRGTFPTLVYAHTDARLAGLDADVEVHPLPWLSVGAHASLLRARQPDARRAAPRRAVEPRLGARPRDGARARARARRRLRRGRRAARGAPGPRPARRVSAGAVPAGVHAHRAPPRWRAHRRRADGARPGRRRQRVRPTLPRRAEPLPLLRRRARTQRLRAALGPLRRLGVPHLPAARTAHSRRGAGAAGLCGTHSAIPLSFTPPPNTMNRILLAAAALLIFPACDSGEPDGDGAGDEELITQGTVTLTPVGGTTAVSLTFSDPDGEGGDDPTFTGSLALAPGAVYDGSITVADGRNLNDVEDITAEIREEAEAHRFDYAFEPASIGTVTLTDTESDYASEDENGGDFAVGLAFRITVTGAAGASGDMRAILYHFDDAPKTNSTDTSLEKDIEILIPVTIASPAL